MRINIGTRKSNLALEQCRQALQAIEDVCPEIEFDIKPIVTTGDKITNINLYDIGGKALFLKELEEALLAGEIDIAVHSLKDVPGIIPQALKIAAVLPRHDARDCFISHKYRSIQQLPINAVVGTSSVRRKVIIQQQRPDIEIVGFRGNVNTRLNKLAQGQVDATILACAGLERVHLFDNNYCFPIAPANMLPAAGQGIISLQIRTQDHIMEEICQKINHQSTWALAQAERAFLTYLDASCRTPMSAYAVYEQENIKADFMLASLDGNKIEYCTMRGSISEAAEIGTNAAKQLKALIGEEIY